MENSKKQSMCNLTNVKRLFHFVFAAFLLFLSSSFKSAEDNPDALVGVWKTGEGNALVRITKNGDKYQGKIVWLKEPNDPETGKPKVDKTILMKHLAQDPFWD
jgi:uncharacterized protein (DUF2147 family)